MNRLDDHPHAEVAAPAPEEVCTTSEAARLLGVSNTSVQIMVERGELQAWRTQGGHRRVSLESILALKARRVAGLRTRSDPDLLTVLIVEDDESLAGLYQARIKAWELPLKILTAGDGLEALLTIERNRPDVLITDLRMQPMSGFEFLCKLRTYPEFNSMTIIVVTGLSDDEVAAEGGLPKGVVLYHKPAPFEKLQGFIEASVLRKQLAQS